MTRQPPTYLAPHLLIYNVPPEMQVRLIKWAAILGMSKTQLAKIAILEYLDRKENPMEYYLLRRDDDYQIVCVTAGSDPLYGHGSWSLAGGPFASWDEAQDYWIHHPTA